MPAINPALIDVVFDDHDGYPEEIAREDTRDNMKGAAEDAGAIVTDFPDHMWIERKDWKAVAEQNTINGTWGMDYLDRLTNQNPTHECTSHAFRACFESCRNRQRRIKLGPPVPKQRLPVSLTSASVWISCLSLYAEANPRQWGGAGVVQILNIATKRGCLPDKIQPREWGFKCAIQGTCGGGNVNQSKGVWLPLSQFPEGWQEEAKHFKPLEYIFPESWEQTVCLLLHGFMVGVGRQGHSIPYGMWDEANQVAPYPDSYDIIRYDSVKNIKQTVGGSYAIVSTTTPDDWEKPVGIPTLAI